MVGFGTRLDRRSLLLGRIRPRLEPASGMAANATQYLRQINVDRCVGCDVCARICPPGALRIHHEDQRTFYVVDPARCDGCGLCLELCEVGAINMTRERPYAGVKVVELFSAQCQRCGAPFHLPRNVSSGTSLCRICAARSP